MRVIQIIDSLEAGGAERMAVNYANGLASKIAFSGIVATRKEGVLKEEINNKAVYFFLNRKHTLDFQSVFRLKSFVKENDVTIVHAHGTSFFIAFLLKLIYPKIKIIWHEHYGERANQSFYSNLILSFCSIFFSLIFVVNKELEFWVKKQLFTREVFFIPNFVVKDKYKNQTILHGSKGKRIVLLANLKKPKNHILSLIAFNELNLINRDWTLHFVGRDYDDSYSSELKKYVKDFDLQDFVFFYDTQKDVANILSQATIGILCSTNEGFPLTLLEYGLAKLTVITTNVGFCNKLIDDNRNGLLFNPLDSIDFKKKLEKSVVDEVLRDYLRLNLYNSILENYSEEKIITLLVSKYCSI